MKRAGAILLALIMCMMMGAWTSPAAFEAYDALNEKMADITSVEMEMSGAIDMTIGTQSTAILMDAKVTQVANGDDFDMLMKMNMYMAGQTVPATCYYTEGTMYYDVMGLKFKMDAQVDTSMVDFDIDASTVLTSSVSDTPRGTELFFRINADAMNSAMQSAMGALNMQLGDESSINLNTMEYTIVVGDDDMMKSCEIVMDTTIGTLGGLVGARYKINCDVTAYNSVESIVFPADLDTYTADIESLVA